MCLLTAAFSSLPDRPIEMLAFLPQVERIDSHTARFEVPDMAAAVRSESHCHASPFCAASEDFCATVFEDLHPFARSDRVCDGLRSL